MKVLHNFKNGEGSPAHTQPRTPRGQIQRGAPSDRVRTKVQIPLPFPGGLQVCPSRSFLYSFEEGAGGPRSAEESRGERRVNGVLRRRGGLGVGVRTAGDQMQTGAGEDGRGCGLSAALEEKERDGVKGKRGEDLGAGTRREAGLTLVFPLFLRRAFKHHLR